MHQTRVYPTTLKQNKRLFFLKAQTNSSTIVVEMLILTLPNRQEILTKKITKKPQNELTQQIKWTQQTATEYFFQLLHSTPHILLGSPWSFLQNGTLFRTKSKYFLIQECWNNFLHSIRSQLNETRTQQQNNVENIQSHRD